MTVRHHVLLVWGMRKMSYYASDMWRTSPRVLSDSVLLLSIVLATCCVPELRVSKWEVIDAGRFTLVLRETRCGELYLSWRRERHRDKRFYNRLIGDNGRILALSRMRSLGYVVHVEQQLWLENAAVVLSEREGNSDEQ